MPTYQYRCTECGSDLEVVQKFTDDALTECPTCGGDLRKVFNAVGVVFKGSGFYKTDSRGSKSASTPAAPSTPAASTSSESTPSATPAKTESTTAPAASSISAQSTAKAS